MSTISQQLFRSVVPGIVFALVIGGAMLDLLIVNRLEREFDEVLATKARTLMALTERENGVVELERYEHVLPGYADPREPDYFVMFEADGEPIARSPSMRDHTWLAATGGSDLPARRDIDLPDGRDGRVFGHRFVPAVDDEEGGVVSEATPVVLWLAISREPLDRLITSVHFVLGGTGFALIVVIVLLARRGIGRTLAPLEHIGEQVQALDTTRLDERLALETSSEELERLTSRFNELLERLGTGFERERRFSNDVAHELRTPLAELRAAAEVNARWPDDPRLRASFASDQLASIERMERTVSSLLALARSENGVDGVDGPVDLVALVRRGVGAFETRAATRGLTLRLALPIEPLVTAGDGQWRAIAANLLDNACEYAVADSAVEVSLVEAPGDGSWTLSVENRSDDLSPEDLVPMFERLWRKDPARSSERHGGLGLSLVAAYARQLGVHVEATLDPAGRLRVALEGIVPNGAHAPERQRPVASARLSPLAVVPIGALETT